MAGLKDSYSGPSVAGIRETRVSVTGAASASMAKYLYYQKTKVKRVQALVTTAGTNAAASFDVYNGTTSVGTIAVGTNTAGAVVSSGVLDTVVSAGGFLEIKGIANSATAVAALSIVEQVSHDDVTA